MRLFAIPVLLLTALIGFVVSHPAASSWILQEVQAEFAGTGGAPDTTQATKQAKEFRAVKVH